LSLSPPPLSLDVSSGQISKMKDNRVIWIPKRFHDEIEKFEGKQIRIVIDDEL
jgi:hypothetical protein